MIRALQAAQDYVNFVAHEAITEWRRADREAENFLHGHFLLHNPTFKQDVQRRQMIAVFWEMAAAVGILVGFGLLIYLMESMR